VMEPHPPQQSPDESENENESDESESAAHAWRTQQRVCPGGWLAVGSRQ
jgi:hypothetical protein